MSNSFPVYFGGNAPEPWGTQTLKIPLSSRTGPCWAAKVSSTNSRLPRPRPVRAHETSSCDSPE